MAGKPLLIKVALAKGKLSGGVITGLLPNLVPPMTTVGNRDGTFTVTGGGVVVPNAVKGGQTSMTVTGGGVIAMSGRKGAQATISVTGGGVVQLLAAKGAQVVQNVTGGGRITVLFQTGREVVLNITGGGVITIDAAGPAADMTLIEIEFDEGGAGPIQARRRGQTEFDEWTIPMDDEAILQLYAMRKTR